MSNGMGLTATGIIVHNRSNGLDFAMHPECWDALATEAGINPLDDTAPAVVIGPCFADASEWVCPVCKVASA